MSQAPFEQAGSLRIGTVDFVSPDKIEVGLDIEAPESVALNAGAPRPFPRVNGYLLIPVDEGFLAGQIEWLTVERSAFPKRRGMQDFGARGLALPTSQAAPQPARHAPRGGRWLLCLQTRCGGVAISWRDRGAADGGPAPIDRRVR